MKDRKITNVTFVTKAFCQQGNLNTHINDIHKNLKNHQCDLCGNGFSQSNNLMEHIKHVHEGQKIYKLQM